MKLTYTFLLLFILKTALIQAQNVSFSTSTLPIIKVNTNQGTIVNEPKILADLEIIYNGTGKINAITDKPTGYLG